MVVILLLALLPKELVALWVTWFLYQTFFKPKVERHLKHQSLMLVFGSGGHTTELLLMLESLNI